MKKNKLILILLFICPFFIWADYAYVTLTENNTVGGISLMYSNYFDKSSEYILGDYIKRTENLLTNISVNIKLIKRDRNPVINPIYSEFGNDVLVGIAESNAIEQCDYNIDNNFVAITDSYASNISYYIGEQIDRCLPEKCIIQFPSQTNHISYVVGPAEFVVASEVKRYIYKGGHSLQYKLNNLPRMLDANGNTIAYNDKDNIIVVIAGKDNNVIRILNTLGLEQINMEEK